MEPLQPRLYSIASSHKAGPGRVSLTIDHVRYAIGGRERLGVASTLAGMALRPGDKVKAYIQRAHNFALPADGDTPIVMVGPGTGVAPFCRSAWPEAPRARPGRSLPSAAGHGFFLRGRTLGIPGGGHAFEALACLVARWRKKVYVQDRMREEAAHWLGKGAHFYVCGDANRMAADVDATFVQICAEHGQMDAAAAKAFVKTIRAQHRYQADVY